MSRRQPLPVVDHIRQMLSAGCPVDAALLSAEAVERECIAAASLSMRDKELINKWREKDRRRKKQKRAVSTGRAESPLYTSAESINNKREEKKEAPVSGGRPAVKRPSSQGIELPEDWRPSTGHYREAERAGLNHDDVDRIAGRMRNWAIANRHRREARKADLDGWNATFSGTWLAKEIDERRKAGGRPTAAKTLGDLAFGRRGDGA